MDDLISKQAAIEALEREKVFCSVFTRGHKKSIFEQYNKGLNDGIIALNNLPTIDPVKHWEWIDKKTTHERKFVQYKYCPHCGERLV